MERVLPVRRYVRLAVDYANLESPDHIKLIVPTEPRDPVELKSVWLAALNKMAREVTDIRYAHRKAPIKDASHSFRQAWVRDLMAIAAASGRPSEDDAEGLLETFQDQKLELTLAYTAGNFDGWIDVPDADLFWFISLGCAALLDQRGPYHGMVAKCKNFDGPRDKKVTYRACTSYVLKVSTGGRPSSDFCSAECRNAVNQRAETRHSRKPRKPKAA